MKKLVLFTFLGICSLYSLANTYTVDYILATSSTDGERKITRLCVFDSKENMWDWQLFYTSSGSYSSMPNTVLPFYGFNKSGFIKPHGGLVDKALEYYKEDYLERIISSKDIIDDFNQTMNTYAADVWSRRTFLEVFKSSLPIREFFTRMDNLDLLEISYQFRSGVWDSDEVKDNIYITIANLIKSTKVVKNNFYQDIYVFNKKPQQIINMDEYDKNLDVYKKLISSFVGYYDPKIKCSM